MLSGRLWRQMESQARAKRLEWPCTATTRRSTGRAFRGSVTMALATKSGSFVSSTHSSMPTMTCAYSSCISQSHIPTVCKTLPELQVMCRDSQCCMEYDSSMVMQSVVLQCTTPMFAGHCTIGHGLISLLSVSCFIHSLPSLCPLFAAHVLSFLPRSPK